MSTIDMDWVHDLIGRYSDHIEGNTCTFHNGAYARMAEEIAATVGNRTDLSKRLREVHGLHAFAELFGFDWEDESDWSWHDVACAMADAIDAAAGVGTCAMKPDGYYGEEYGIYKCSNCGELWQFECDGPREHGWTCCPKCRARIIEED